jgi:hypothetical protein
MDDAIRQGARTEGARGPAGDSRSQAAVVGGQAAAAGSGPSPSPTPVAGEDDELSVEGLGLADLLAGALAAYRAI